MDTVGIIKPQYVWITSGVAKWTNEKGAEVLAKRKAKISGWKLVKVARVLNSKFYVVDEEEFIRRTSNTKYAYMYGTIIQVSEEDCLNGDISAITTDNWSAISYFTYTGEKKLVPPSKREIIQRFEENNKSISPPFTTRCESITHKEPGHIHYMVLAAMIVGEPQ